MRLCYNGNIIGGYFQFMDPLTPVAKPAKILVQLDAVVVTDCGWSGKEVGALP
jgi:hypothetical protein